MQGLRFHADHRPECAWLPGADSRACPALSPVQRPGWLLHEPTLLAEQGLQILLGPERIESGWWDGADIRRDYYLVRTRSGQQGWAYRTVGDSAGLWLQGWFA